MATFHDPEDICGAWAEVARVMPEGWYLRSLRCFSGTSTHKRERIAVDKHGPHWRAIASRRHDLGMKAGGMLGLGPTAAAALWQLSDYLTNVGRSGWSPIFGDPTFVEAASPDKGEPPPKRKRIDWSDVVVDEGDEAP